MQPRLAQLFFVGAVTASWSFVSGCGSSGQGFVAPPDLTSSSSSGGSASPVDAGGTDATHGGTSSGGASGSSSGAATASSGGGASGSGGSSGSSGAASSGSSSSGKAGGSGGSSGSSGGGSSGAGSSGGVVGVDGGGCTATWPAADPAAMGPYAIVTENNVGPTEASDGTMYTMFRPATLGACHPVITWGNGTGTTPSAYAFVLNHLASHGFVVIASNSMNVGTGTPPPMLDGVTWVIQQNSDPTSELYQHIDVAHIGATGHSQGAFATVTAGADPRIVAIAPIEGSTPTTRLHGPALLLCGGMDTTVGCTGTQQAFTSITNVPVMFAELLAASHTSWITDSFMRNAPTAPFVVAVTAWMRVHLMGDTALRPMFYSPSCTLCTDTADWTVQQKMLN